MLIAIRVGLIIAALPLFASTAVAQETMIPCPAEAIETNVTTSLPDGWWSTPQGGKLSDIRTLNVGGRATLVCIYKTNSAQASIARYAPSGMECSAAGRGFRCRAGQSPGGVSSNTKSVAVDGQAVAKVPTREQDDKQLTPGNIKSSSAPEVRTAGSCPDLALTGVEVRMLSRDPQGQYFFRLAAALENRGGADYRSSRGQQRVDIYQVTGGGGAHRLGSFDFDAVSAGSDHVEATYDVLHWRTSQEFPPSYRFEIAYGPDIAADGNSANDDCTRTNNSTTITGDEIDTIIRGSGI